MKRTAYMLTTHDNPYDPFDNFDSWFMFDNDAGYNCCGLLARVACFSDELTELENSEEQKRAIDEIIKYDALNNYKRVSKELEFDDETGEIIEQS